MAITGITGSDSHKGTITVSGSGFGTEPVGIKHLWIMGGTVYVNGVPSTFLSDLLHDAWIKGTAQTTGGTGTDVNSLWESVKFVKKSTDAESLRHNLVDSAFIANSRDPAFAGSNGSCALLRANFDQVGQGGPATSERFYATWMHKFPSGSPSWSQGWDYDTATGATFLPGDSIQAGDSGPTGTFLEFADHIETSIPVAFMNLGINSGYVDTVINNRTRTGTFTIRANAGLPGGTYVAPASTKVGRYWNENGTSAYGIADSHVVGGGANNVFYFYDSLGAIIPYSTSGIGVRDIDPPTGAWPTVAGSTDWHRVELIVDFGAYKGVMALDGDADMDSPTVTFDSGDYTDIDAAIATGNVTLSNWGMDGSTASGNESAWGELFCQNDLSRFVVGNASTWAAVTEWEPQRMTAKADGELTIENNQGNLSTLAGNWAYYRKSDGSLISTTGFLFPESAGSSFLPATRPAYRKTHRPTHRKTNRG